MTTTERYNYAFDPDGNDWPARLLRQVPVGASVLELGPGPGAMTQVMTAKGHQVTVVENDPQAIMRLKTLGVEVIEANLNDPNWSERLRGRRFDALLACDVLEHLNAPQETLVTLRELAGSDARLVISMPNVAYAGLVAGLRLGFFEYAATGLLDRTHMRFFTRGSLFKLLMSTGWAPQHWEGLHLPIEESEFVWAWGQVDAGLRQAMISGWSEFDVYEWMTVAVPQSELSTARIQASEEELISLKQSLHSLQLRHTSEHDSLIEHQKAFSEAKVEIRRLSSELAENATVIQHIRDEMQAAVAEIGAREQSVMTQQEEIQRLQRELEVLRAAGWTGRVRRLVRALRA